MYDVNSMFVFLCFTQIEVTSENAYLTSCKVFFKKAKQKQKYNSIAMFIWVSQLDYIFIYNLITDCMHGELYRTQRPNWDPGRGEEIVYVGGPL